MTTAKQAKQAKQEPAPQRYVVAANAATSADRTHLYEVGDVVTADQLAGDADDLVRVGTLKPVIADD